MNKSIQIEVEDSDDTICIPFDNDNEGKYKLEIDSENYENGDGVVLELNKKACLHFAKLFGQLALGPYGDDYHVHLGYEDDLQPGPGFRIVLKENK